MTMGVIRERQLNVRLNDDEWTRLEALAQHYGISPGFVVRMLIKREETALGITGPKPASRAKPKK